MFNSCAGRVRQWHSSMWQRQDGLRFLIKGPCEHVSFSGIFWAERVVASTEGMGPSSLPGLSQLTPNPGIWVQEDQVYILILRRLCLSSPDPLQPKGERKWRVSWAKKGNHTNTDQNQVMSLWAFCTIATVNTWKAFDSHISKTCHKARASPLPTDLAPSHAGGALSQRRHSALARLSWSGLRGETSTESSHRCAGNYSIRSQQPLREGVLKYLNPEGQWKWVSQITLFYREGNWHFRWGFSPAAWIFMFTMCQTPCIMLRKQWFLTSVHSEETVSHGHGT